jgi:predicted phage-related endonuclease
MLYVDKELHVLFNYLIQLYFQLMVLGYEKEKCFIVVVGLGIVRLRHPINIFRSNYLILITF